jgi:uncharacterized SAM-binding protein YcdF (DUF218 family)
MAFVLGKVLNFLFLPPGIFIVGLVVLGVLATRARSARSLRYLAFGLAAALYLCSIGPVRSLLVDPLERAYPPPPADARADAVVILGGGAAAAPDRPGGEGLTDVALARVVHGFELARGIGAPVIVSSGNPFGSTKATEAELMSRELLALGARDASITVEGRSRSTLENARFTAAICARRGFSRILLVTSAVHMPRSVRCFEHFGTHVLPAPTDYLSGGPAPILVGLIPTADNTSAIVAALHEYLGGLYYRVAYGV